MLTHVEDAKSIRNISSKLFEGAAIIIVSLLILIILITLSWAALEALFDLKAIFIRDIHGAIKEVIVQSLTILALLEVLRTALTYFSQGRVKVTYIIDTVLVVILTEVMAFWFKEIEYSKILMVIALVLSLIVARILAIRFSPARYQDDI